MKKVECDCCGTKYPVEMMAEYINKHGMCEQCDKEEDDREDESWFFADIDTDNEW